MNGGTDRSDVTYFPQGREHTVPSKATRKYQFDQAEANTREEARPEFWWEFYGTGRAGQNKKPTSKIKRQLKNWEKIFVMQVTEKGLMCLDVKKAICFSGLEMKRAGKSDTVLPKKTIRQTLS